MVRTAKLHAAFLRECFRGSRHHGETFSLPAAISAFPRWTTALAPGRSSLADRSPWLTFRAIDELDRIVNRDMTVFEYGSGGSTLFFADRAARVVSVEHVPAWHEKVTGFLNASGVTNASVELIEPEPDPSFGRKDPADPGHFVSTDALSAGYSFVRYVNRIAAFPDGTLDVVVIDGRSRPSCCRAAQAKVRPGGYLVFDNTETPYYRPALEELTPDRWDVRHLYGPVPYIKHFSQTTIARKR